jgi:hypothetical protein
VKADFELPVPAYKSVHLNQTTEEARGLEKQKHWQPQLKGHLMMIDGNYTG